MRDMHKCVGSDLKSTCVHRWRPNS